MILHGKTLTWRFVRYLRDMFGLFLFALSLVGAASKAEKDILYMETYKGITLKASMIIRCDSISWQLPLSASQMSESVNYSLLVSDLLANPPRVSNVSLL